jgi:hypothetical protein
VDVGAANASAVAWWSNCFYFSAAILALALAVLLGALYFSSTCPTPITRVNVSRRPHKSATRRILVRSVVLRTGRALNVASSLPFV